MNRFSDSWYVADGRSTVGLGHGLTHLLSALGPFYTVEHHPPGSRPVPPWRALRELVERPEPLLTRITAVRHALASRDGRRADQIEPRIAASITHLGLVARLISPALAATASGHHLDMPVADLWWQDRLGGPVPLSIPRPLGLTTPSPNPGDHRHTSLHTLIDEVIEPITAAPTRLVTVSPRVLWGNVASAVNSAATQLATRLPDLAPQAYAAALSMFRHARLGHESRPPGPTYRRTSCCLLYRLTPDDPRPACGDCVLLGRHRRSRR